MGKQMESQNTFTWWCQAHNFSLLNLNIMHFAETKSLLPMQLRHANKENQLVNMQSKELWCIFLFSFLLSMNFYILYLMPLPVQWSSHIVFSLITYLNKKYESYYLLALFVKQQHFCYTVHMLTDLSELKFCSFIPNVVCLLLLVFSECFALVWQSRACDCDSCLCSCCGVASVGAYSAVSCFWWNRWF